MFEIELKFKLNTPEIIRQAIVDRGGVSVSLTENRDTYFEHPCRNFRETGEALRVRLDDGMPCVTYKGPKRSGAEDAAKAREELEWRLDPGDADGSRMSRMLTRLGFKAVATVVKRREIFRIQETAHVVTVTLDDVEGLGWFAEIEMVLDDVDPTAAMVEQTRQRLDAIAADLQLRQPESRSYLRMVLERQAS